MIWFSGQIFGSSFILYGRLLDKHWGEGRLVDLFSIPLLLFFFISSHRDFFYNFFSRSGQRYLIFWAVAD